MSNVGPPGALMVWPGDADGEPGGEAEEEPFYKYLERRERDLIGNEASVYLRPRPPKESRQLSLLKRFPHEPLISRLLLFFWIKGPRVSRSSASLPPPVTRHDGRRRVPGFACGGRRGPRRPGPHRGVTRQT